MVPLLPATAQAAVAHTVAPGETLWQLAAMNNMTTRSFAAANGLSPDAHIVSGTTIRIPSIAEAAGALAGAPAAAAPAGVATSAAPQPMGGYTVRPGDSLSAIAVTARVPTSAIASMNGLDPQWRPPRRTPCSSCRPAPRPPPAPRSLRLPRRRVPQAAPYASSGRVSSADIAAVASRNGVPASLASAIAWQESGFNNAMVSSANARGVMQVMPGTWSWVQANLARRQLDPSARRSTTSAPASCTWAICCRRRAVTRRSRQPATTRASARVRSIGMLPETQRYVANVMALRSRFGG